MRGEEGSGRATGRQDTCGGSALTRRALLLGGGALGTVALTGCGISLGGPERDPEPPEPWLTIVCTTPILGEVARMVGGGRVEVRTMMPPVADPRRFVPGPAAGDVFVGADLVIRHGMGLEAGLEALLAASDLPIVVATEDLPTDQVPALPGGAPDPYVWHDPTAWPWVVSRVARALLDADDTPTRQRAWDRNAAFYLRQVGEAHAYLDRRLALVPAGRRLLATPDATFGWFARRYGFETVALQDDTVPVVDDAALSRFADRLVAAPPPVAFLDAGVTTDVVDIALIRAALAGADIPVGPMLYGSGLATGGGYAARYLGMVRQNADRIVAVLTAD